MPRLLFSLSALTLLCLFPSPNYAALIGTSVTGSLEFNGGPLNFFDPVFGFVPNGYLNSAGTTVTISNSAVEFGYDDSANRITADFTDNQLVISNLVEASSSNLPFTMVFTDTALSGQVVTTVSDNFPLTYSLNGSVLTVNWAGGNVTTGQTFTGTFNIAPAPEPSAVGLLLCSGLAAVAVSFYRYSRMRCINPSSVKTPISTAQTDISTSK